MLNNEEIEEILEIIRNRILAFSHEAVGPVDLTPVEMEALGKAGMLRSSERHLVEDGYEFGKAAALLGPSATRGMSFEAVKRAVSKLAPMTGVEKAAMEYASRAAGQYIRGVMGLMLKDVSTTAARTSGAALRAIADGTAEAIVDRKTISEFQSQLFHLIDDRSRDWQRVAHTELGNAIQHGIYSEIRDKSDEGVDQLVFKRPNPDACKHCNRIYLKADGITPRVFRLRDLEASNVGLKAADWNAVIGTVHPWCNCITQIIPEGFDFIHKNTVKEPFEHDGKSYKRGQILTEPEYLVLRRDFEDHIGKDAILSYTGITALPETMKSLESHPIFDDDPICEH